ncbi:MAG: hypothetical protein ACC662_04100 [Planctomycetota bacterium]
MSPRLKRVLKRTILALVVLGVLGLAAFTWLAYWPLEGRVDSVAALVPADVDFIYRASWKGLKETGWLQENLIDRPLVPQIGEGVTEALRFLDRLRAQEALINDQIPLHLATFSFEDDLVPDEIVAAGRFCTGTDPAREMPGAWYHILVLTRVSWKGKLVAALKHGFVRNNLDPNIEVEEVGDDIYRITIRNMRVAPPRQRRCGPGEIRPPYNTWYLTRIKDVLALSNAEGLIQGVQDVAEFPDSGRAYVDRPRVELDRRSDGVAASLDVQPLDNYLVRAMDVVGSPYTILKRYVTIPALRRLNGWLRMPSLDQVRAHADIRFLSTELAPGVADVYRLPPERTRGGVAVLVPQEDTFAALLLRTSPKQLLEGIYQDVLSPGQPRHWQDNLRRVGGYESVEAFLTEFASKLGNTAGIAVGRVSDVYDDVDYPAFYADPEAYPDPNFPALAMMVYLDRGTSPEELDADLAKRVPQLGGSSELTKVEYRGLTYTRAKLQHESADFHDGQPCWVLGQNHFIFASNEGYFRKILDTVIDPKASPPLADDPTFRSTMANLPEKAHVALFVNLERLFQVPPDLAPGRGPRGYLWDCRNLWINANRNPREAAIDYRKRRTMEMMKRTGQALTAQQQWAIDDEVAAHVKEYGTQYGKFLEEYRERLEGFRRLRGLGIGIVAAGESLTTDAVILFRPAGKGRAGEEP